MPCLFHKNCESYLEDYFFFLNYKLYLQSNFLNTLFWTDILL